MVCCREDSEDQRVKLCRKWCFTTFGPTVLIWGIWKRVSTETCRGTPTRHSWRTGGALHWNSQRQRWRWDAMAGQGVSRAKESPVLGCSWTSWMFLAGARWEMSGLDHSPQDHSRSSSHDVSVTQELEPMIEGVDEAIESAKSEVVSHPLKMEIEIEEEIKEDPKICKSCVAVCGHVLTWLQRMTKHVAKNVERNRTKSKSVCSIENISYLGKITADSLSSSANVLWKDIKEYLKDEAKKLQPLGWLDQKEIRKETQLSRILMNIWHHLGLSENRVYSQL